MGYEQHHVLVRLAELEALEHEQVDCGEALAEPPTQRLGVADRQKLGGNDHRQSAGGLEERRGVDESRRPRGREPGEADALGERSQGGALPSVPAVLLVPDKWRVANDGVLPGDLGSDLRRR